MTFLEVEVQFKDTDQNFRVFTNMPIEGAKDSFKSLIEGWKSKTEDYSRYSFLLYFMSKKPSLGKSYMFTSEKEIKRHFRYMLK